MAEGVEVNSVEFWIYLASTLTLLLICSLTSGLNGSLLELDATHLEILHRSSTPDVQRQVVRAQKVLKHHHLVIFSLVLLHAAADEALPILLSYITPNEYTAIAVAVPLVLFFGELLPATVISGRALLITSTLSPLIWICVGIAGIITAPLAFIAQKIAGEDSRLTIRNYRRNEITEFLRLHVGLGKHNDNIPDNDEQSLLGDNLLAESRRDSFDDILPDDYTYENVENNNEYNRHNPRDINKTSSRYRSKGNVLANSSSVSSSMFKPLLSDTFMDNNDGTINNLHKTTITKISTSPHRNNSGYIHPKILIHNTENTSIPNFTTDKSDSTVLGSVSQHHRHPSTEGISMTVRSSSSPASATPSLVPLTTTVKNNEVVSLSPLLSTVIPSSTPTTVSSNTLIRTHPVPQPKLAHYPPYHHQHSHTHLPRTESDSTTHSIGTVDTVNDSRHSSFDDNVVVHRNLSNGSTNINDQFPSSHSTLITDPLIHHHHHSHDHHVETHTSHHLSGTVHAHQPPSLPPLLEEKPKLSHTRDSHTHAGKHSTSSQDTPSTTQPLPQHKGFLKRWMSKHNLGSNNNTDTDVNSGGSDYESAASSSSHAKKEKQDENSSARDGIGLTAHEVRVIEGTLGLAVRTVSTRMVPIQKLFALSSNDILTKELLQKITSTAHSRIPVYEGTDRNSIVGLLLVKLLLSIDDFGVGVQIGSLPLIRPIVIDPDTSMLDALKAFEKGKSHMAIVTKERDTAEHALLNGLPIPSASQITNTANSTLSTGEVNVSLTVNVLGIVTLEDCLLEVLNAGTGKHNESHHHHSSKSHHSSSYHHHGNHPSHPHHYSSTLPRAHSIRDSTTIGDPSGSSTLKREASGIFSSIFSSITGSGSVSNSVDDESNKNLEQVNHANSSANSSRGASPLFTKDNNNNTKESYHNDSRHSTQHSVAAHTRSRGNSMSGLHGRHSSQNHSSSASPLPTEDNHISSSNHGYTSHSHHHHQEQGTSHNVLESTTDTGTLPAAIPQYSSNHHAIHHHSNHDQTFLSSTPTDAPLNLISDAHEMRALLKHYERTKSHRILSHQETQVGVTPIPSTPTEIERISNVPIDGTINND